MTVRHILTGIIMLAVLAGGAIHAQPSCAADGLAAGAAAATAGDHTGAVVQFTCALATDPANLAAYLGRMEAALFSAQYGVAIADANFLKDNATDLFNAAVEAAVQEASFAMNDVNALTMRAFLYWATASDDLALADYDAILRAQPGNGFAYLFRGSSLQYLGDVLLASDDFRDAAAADPNNVHVFSVIGSTYAQTGEYDRALQFLNSALQIDPAHARAHYFVGFVLLERNVTDAAIENFTRALEIDPAMIDAYYDRGLAYGRLVDYPAALADLNQALALNPGSRLAMVARARIHELIGNIPAALADYTDYVRLNLLRQVNGEPLFPGLPVTLTMEDGLVYRLPITAAAGQMIYVRAQSPNNLADPLILLLNESGTTVAASDDLTVGDFTAEIGSYITTAGGTYMLLLTHSDGGFRGRVDVTLEVR